MTEAASPKPQAPLTAQTLRQWADELTVAPYDSFDGHGRLAPLVVATRYRQAADALEARERRVSSMATQLQEAFEKMVELDSEALERPLPAVPQTQHCAGCHRRWEGHAPVVLCGDCWRLAQPVLHAPLPTAPSDPLPADPPVPDTPIWTELTAGLWECRFCGMQYRQPSCPKGGSHVVGCPIGASDPPVPEPDPMTDYVRGLQRQLAERTTELDRLTTTACLDCDHGVCGGVPCSSCGGRGTMSATDQLADRDAEIARCHARPDSLKAVLRARDSWHQQFLEMSETYLTEHERAEVEIARLREQVAYEQDDKTRIMQMSDTLQHQWHTRVRELEQTISSHMPKPQIVPRVAGGEQHEWHQDGWDVEIECQDGRIVGAFVAAAADPPVPDTSDTYLVPRGAVMDVQHTYELVGLDKDGRTVVLFCLSCRHRYPTHAGDCARTPLVPLANAEIARCHSVITEAESLIDPERHPDWIARAEAETVRCDQILAALKAEREAADDTVVGLQATLNTLTAERDALKRCEQYPPHVAKPEIVALREENRALKAERDALKQRTTTLETALADLVIAVQHAAKTAAATEIRAEQAEAEPSADREPVSDSASVMMCPTPHIGCLCLYCTARRNARRNEEREADREPAPVPTTMMETQHCAGCHRCWEGNAPVVLCGDCWRRAQGAVLPASDPPKKDAWS